MPALAQQLLSRPGNTVRTLQLPPEIAVNRFIPCPKDCLAADAGTPTRMRLHALNAAHAKAECHTRAVHGWFRVRR